MRLLLDTHIAVQDMANALKLRVLVAQAVAEPGRFLTHAAKVAAYRGAIIQV